MSCNQLARSCGRLDTVNTPNTYKDFTESCGRCGRRRARCVGWLWYLGKRASGRARRCLLGMIWLGKGPDPTHSALGAVGTTTCVANLTRSGALPAPLRGATLASALYLLADSAFLLSALQWSFSSNPQVYFPANVRSDAHHAHSPRSARDHLYGQG